MKRLYLLLIPFLICTIEAHADAPDDPRYYFFVVQSPQGKCYAVQTLTSWGTLRGRFQMFEATTGRLMWQIDKVFGRSYDVYIPDDGEHVVVAHSLTSAHGWNPTWTNAPDADRNELHSQPSTEVYEKIKSNDAVEFYMRDHLIKRLTIGDLGIPAAALLPTVSHVMFYSPNDEGSSASWVYAPEKRLGGNPMFLRDLMLLQLEDKTMRVLNIETGELLGALTTEEFVRNSKVFTPSRKDLSDTERMREQTLFLLEQHSREGKGHKASNKLSDATSEPAPDAASSSHQD